MRFIPFDIGRYFVKSRSRNGHHIVDVLEATCSCEGYQFTEPCNTCAHIREAIRRRRAGKLSMIVAMRGHQV